MKRHHQREETKNQKTARVIAEKKRKDWLMETYLEMINYAGKHQRVKNIVTPQEFHLAEAKKRKKFTDSRTENTLRGSKGISAESRLAKRAKKDELKEEQKRVKLLNENVKMRKRL